MQQSEVAVLQSQPTREGAKQNSRHMQAVTAGSQALLVCDLTKHLHCITSRSVAAFPATGAASSVPCPATGKRNTGSSGRI